MWINKKVRHDPWQHSTKDIYKVATALGHSSVETTRKHYADFDENQKKEIAGQVRVGH